MALKAANVRDHEQKWAYLLHSAGDKVMTIETHLQYEKGDTDHYTALHGALTAHFRPKQNEAYAAFQFRKIKQEEDEPVDAFLCRLREQASRCNYGEQVDRHIRDQLIFGIKIGKVRTKALAENLDLTRLADIARAAESAQLQASDIEKDIDHSDSLDVNRIRHTPGKYSSKQQLTPPPKSQFQPKPYQSRAPAQGASQSQHAGQRKCGWCGILPSHDRPSCPALNSTCNTCQKKGHWSSVCRSKQKKPLYCTQVEDPNLDPPTDQFEDYLLQQIVSINSLTPSVANSRNVPITLGGNTVHFRPDSGADANVITVGAFQQLSPRPPLHTSKHELWAYGAPAPLKAIGAFESTAIYGDKSTKATFHVVQLAERWCCLLSEDTSKELGLIIMGKSINSINSSSATTRLVQEYDDIFQGIGLHKETTVSLPMDESVKPVAAPPARVPFHLLPGLKAELDRLEKEGAIEDVPVDDTNQWVSRIVPVPRKIEGSNKPGIRLTIDWRNVNKGLKKVHHSIPTLEQLRYDLNGAQAFAELDLTDAFSQLGLDEASKKITTFSTPWGLKRMTRLVQGATPSSSIFHETLRRDLEGLHNTLNIADNIIVWGCGETEEEVKRDLLSSLEAIFSLLRRKGLTLNKRKCTFYAEKISFFGYTFSKHGVSPDPEKIKALHEATPPETKEDCRSFLGMAGFNQQFIPDYASMAEPIRRLTTKDAIFSWGTEQQKAFDHIKKALEETALLSYFCPDKRTVLFTDASPVGVHATLAQEEKDGSMRPLGFASRALSTTEQNYSQIEREALGMHFGCNRYRLFLLGSHFTHFIDPETLKPMMVNPRKDAPARIERIRLKLQGYDSEIKLISGKKNPADYLSRHPLALNTCSKAELLEFSDIENHIYYVTANLPSAITIESIRFEVPNDPILAEVMGLLTADRSPSSLDHATKKRLHDFINVWDQLSIGKGVVLKGEKIVLPNTLRNSAVKLSHAGHLGIQKSKQYLRSSVWFPGMDQLVEKQVKTCLPCQATTSSHSKQPLQMSELPSEPWQAIAADLFGPLPTGEKILVLKCLRSKWPELKIFLRNQATNATNVIAAMEKIFANHGIPEEITTDNGPPFNSKAFAQFAANAGFHHRKVTPLWPQANGQAESFMKNLGKAIRVAILEKKDWAKSLDQFLVAYRATPHPATGYSPASLLRPGQPYRTRLPATPPTVSAEMLEQHFQQHSEKAKAYADQRSHANISPLKIGDTVLVKQRKLNKFSTPFCADPFTITSVKGSMITASNQQGSITRNSSFFKCLDPDTEIATPPLPRPRHAPPEGPNFSKKRNFSTLPSMAGGGHGTPAVINAVPPAPAHLPAQAMAPPAAPAAPVNRSSATPNALPTFANPNFLPRIKDRNFSLPPNLRHSSRSSSRPNTRNSSKPSSRSDSHSVE